MNIIIRPETEEDQSGIKVINDLAFGHNNEGILIRKLRNTRDFIPGLSLVAESGGRLVGHILFYPIKIKDGDHERIALSLAPMAVHPAYQRNGIGSSLVREGIARAKDMGYSAVIVLGYPDYYIRFGFKPASSFGIRSPFDVPDNVFLAMELMDGALKDIKGLAEYPEPFNETV